MDCIGKTTHCAKQNTIGGYAFQILSFTDTTYRDYVHMGPVKLQLDSSKYVWVPLALRWFQVHDSWSQRLCYMFLYVHQH